MKPYTILAIETIQKHPSDRQIFTGKIKIKDLLELEKKSDRDIRFKIHKWESNQETKKGYQRAPQQKRIDGIKKYLQVEVENPIFPTAILVNARKPLSFKRFETQSKKHEKGEDDFGRLTINQTLYVIDGQHRIEAFKDIMQKRELASKYGYMELPIIILSNFDYKEEVEQFFVINSRQKTIKTDLAQRIFMEISKNDSETKLISEKNKWQMPAITIVDELNRDVDSEWYELIALPDDDKDIRKERVISQNSFVTSLKPFFIGSKQKWDYSSDTSKNGSRIVEECKKLIDNYWKMIKNIWPECFENKKKYILFKTIGVYSLHIVLADYLNTHPNLNEKELMSELGKLLIIARDDNNFTSEFWQIGRTIAREKGQNAGAYSSGAGHNRIALSILSKRNVRGF